MNHKFNQILYLNSSSDSSIRFLINCTCNGNKPALLAPIAPTSVIVVAIPTAPLGKGSGLRFTLSNIKLSPGDTEKDLTNKKKTFITIETTDQDLLSIELKLS